MVCGYVIAITSKDADGNDTDSVQSNSTWQSQSTTSSNSSKSYYAEAPAVLYAATFHIEAIEAIANGQLPASIAGAFGPGVYLTRSKRKAKAIAESIAQMKNVPGPVVLLCNITNCKRVKHVQQAADAGTWWQTHDACYYTASASNEQEWIIAHTQNIKMVAWQYTFESEFHNLEEM